MQNPYLEKVLFAVLAPGIEKYPDPLEILKEGNCSLKDGEHYIGKEYTIARQGDEYRIARTGETQRTISAIIEIGFKKYGVWRTTPNQHSNAALCAFPIEDFDHNYKQGDPLLSHERYNKSLDVAPCMPLHPDGHYPISILEESNITVVKMPDGSQRSFHIYTNSAGFSVTEVLSEQKSQENANERIRISEIDQMSAIYAKSISKNNAIQDRDQYIAKSHADVHKIKNLIIERYKEDPANVLVIHKGLGMHGACYDVNSTQDYQRHVIISVVPTLSMEDKLYKCNHLFKQTPALTFKHRAMPETRSIHDQLDEDETMVEIMNMYYDNITNLNIVGDIQSPAYVIEKGDVIKLFQEFQQVTNAKIALETAKHIEEYSQLAPLPVLSENDHREQIIQDIKDATKDFASLSLIEQNKTKIKSGRTKLRKAFKEKQHRVIAQMLLEPVIHSMDYSKLSIQELSRIKNIVYSLGREQVSCAPKGLQYIQDEKIFERGSIFYSELTILADIVEEQISEADNMLKLSMLLSSNPNNGRSSEKEMCVKQHLEFFANTLSLIEISVEDITPNFLRECKNMFEIFAMSEVEEDISDCLEDLQDLLSSKNFPVLYQKLEELKTQNISTELQEPYTTDKETGVYL